MVGKGMTQGAVAELLDVSRYAVNQWCRRARLGGTDALKKRKRGPKSWGCAAPAGT